MAHPKGQLLGAAKTLPDRIAEHFIARIFTGELAPGQRLPPDRELAQQLGVDRTSLRMAMQQLSRMGLVRAVRGSGVSVLDYREHAGLDFLAAVFALPQLSLGGGFLLQTLDDWLELIPFVVGRAFSRATHDDYREMDALFDRQLELCERKAGLAEIAELEVALQDRVARMLGNTGFLLFNNSSRPLRARMAQLYFETSNVRGHVEMHRDLQRQARRSGGVSSEELASVYRAKLRQRTEPLRERLQAMPANPTITETSRRSERASHKRAAMANEIRIAQKKRGKHADVRPMERTIQPSTSGARVAARAHRRISP